MLLCRVEVPEFSTYRHVYAAVSTCVSRGVYDLGALPEDLAKRLMERGEVVLTEVSAELSRLTGIDQLEDYQYLRIVLLKE